jgi:hypothetical protein
MACERYVGALADVAAGAQAAPGVEAHLAACEACRAELQALRHALAMADAEMAGLVTAAPSPALRARIRRAVAEADPSEARPWRLGWLWPSLAAATLLVALGVLAGRGGMPARRAAAVKAVESTAGAPIGPGSRPTEGASTATAGDAATSPATRRHLVAAAVLRGSRRVSLARAVEPEVLVPPGGEKALLQLVALVHRENLAPASLAAAGQPSPDLAELVPLDIKPLEIVPLDPAESSGT